MVAAKTLPRSSLRRRTGLLALLILAFGDSRATRLPAAPPDPTPSRFSLEKGDRVAWIGSSSTKIGVWPRTVEFLLRTRHPGLGLQFERFTTGGGTFATGLENLDAWLDSFRPTVVVFNYGGNDAAAGRKGLPRFQETMAGCIDKARDRGARVALVTPQAADARMAGVEAAAWRTLYAETMLSDGRTQGRTVIDIYHPLDAMQRANQRDDPKYTILKDTIHLTDPAYIAWGVFFYDRLDLPLARTEAVLAADGTVTATDHCEVRDVEKRDGVLAFTRIDEVLPILPPGPLPPRLSVPLEAHSAYLLSVTDLPEGDYEIRCEGELIGVVDARSLAAGVNLNSVLLDGGRKAPWEELARSIWEGKGLDRVGRTRWRFEVRQR